MVQLDNAVKAEMVRIVKKFIEIREQVEKTDRELQALIVKNKSLDEERQNLVREESALFETIKKAYGPGKLDLRNLEWVPEDGKLVN